jgi:SAM-dependent methyltransferase
MRVLDGDGHPATIILPNGLLAGGFSHDIVYDADAGYDLAADFFDDWKWQRVWAKVEWPCIEGILRAIGSEIGGFSSLLDVGLGTGTYLLNVGSRFSIKKSYGVDISGRMLAVAQSKLEGSALVKFGDARNLPFSDESFDVVLLCRVASHLDDLRAAAHEINRVLRRRGFVIISDLDPKHPYKFTRIPFGSGKISIETYKHSIVEWAAIARQAGLHIRDKYIIWSDKAREVGISDLPGTLARSPSHPLSFVLSAQKRS